MVGLAVLCSCGTAVTPQAKPSRVATPEPATVLPTTYVTPSDAGMIEARMREANGWLVEGEYEKAAAGFDRVVMLEPDGVHVAMALVGAAVAYEALGQGREAVARSMDFVEQFPTHEAVRDALKRGVRLAALVEDWDALRRFGERMVARVDLTTVERIDALGAHALGLVGTGAPDAGMRAMTPIGKARALMEEHGFLEVGKLTVGMAQVYFAFGEVLRLQGERVVFDPRPVDFSDALERRCQSLLDAQDAYATAMRAYDAHWSAMAGYRIGSMYQQLHQDIMKIAAPASATTEEHRLLFQGAMQLRYRVLLDKGLKMMDRTLAMAERTGESSAWVQRARGAKHELEQALATTKAVLARLPYSEHDLQRALDSLANKPRDSTR